jgi:hypothetical protein
MLGTRGLMAELRTTSTDDNEFVLSQELCLRTVIRPQVQAKMQEKIEGLTRDMLVTGEQ